MNWKGICTIECINLGRMHQWLKLILLYKFPKFWEGNVPNVILTPHVHEFNVTKIVTVNSWKKLKIVKIIKIV